MIKKSISYKDFNGNDRTDIFYFNINEAEALELRFMHGDFQETISYLNGLQASEDADTFTLDEKYGRELWSIFTEILEKSVGRKSADGRLFVKNDDVKAEFTQSNAMSQLLIELLSDTNKASAFVNGLMSDSSVTTAALAK
jgi:hypothetical protein